MTERSTTAQPARASRARTPDQTPASPAQTSPPASTAPSSDTTADARRRQRPASVLELEIPSDDAPSELVVTAVVPLERATGAPSVPAFLVEGIAADVQPHARDAQGRPTSVLVTAPVDLRGRAPHSFARLRLEATGEAYQPSDVRDVPTLDLEFVLHTPDGIFRAKPFDDAAKGEKTLGRHRSVWKSAAILENGRETRGLVIASLEVRVDGLAVVEFFAVNGLQPYSETGALCGDFCYQNLEVHTSQTIVLPLPRKGERVTVDRGSSTLSLVDDGLVHLWPRCRGMLRRIVLVPAGASHEVVTRAQEVGAFFGSAFAIEGPNSWIECASHGPELGLLAPWTDALNVWGPKGQAGARALLDGVIGGLAGPRASGAIGGAFITTSHGGFHPLGQFQEGEPGGWKIRPVGSFALDRRLLLERWIEAEHGLDRSGVFHFDPRTLKPTTAAGWASRFGGRVPFAWKNHGDGRFPWISFPRNPSDGSIVRTSNVTQGRMVAHGDAVLLSYDDQDDQHEIRDVEPLETLVRFTGSSLVLSILEVLAVNGELARHEYQSPPGDVTFAKLLAQSAATPSAGSTNAGRGLAWDLRAIVSFWEFASDAWRLQRRTWIQAVARWAIVTRGPAGLLGNDPANGHVTEVATTTDGAPGGFRYVQTFEEAYLEQSLEQLASVAMPGAVAERERLAVLRGIIDAVEALWSVRLSSSSIPPKFVAVGIAGGAELQSLDRSKAGPDAEGTWIWGLLACAARCHLRLGDQAGYQAKANLLLQAGRAPESPWPSFEAYVEGSQALEREAWHGSVDYSALAWGEAYALAHGRRIAAS